MSSKPQTEFFVMAPDGSQSGPFTRQRMRELYLRGGLSPEHRLRRSTDEKWFRVRNVTGLFDGLEAGLYVPPEDDAHADAHPGVQALPPLTPMPVQSSEPHPGIDTHGVNPPQANGSAMQPAWIPNEAFRELVGQFDAARTLKGSELLLHVQSAIEIARATKLAEPVAGSTPIEILNHQDGSIELAIPTIDPIPEHLRRNRFGAWFWSGFWLAALLGLLGALVSGAVRQSMRRRLPYMQSAGLAVWSQLGWHSALAASSYILGFTCGGMVAFVLIGVVFARTTKEFGAILAIALFFAVSSGLVLLVRLYLVRQTYRSRTVRRIGGGAGLTAGIT